MKTIPLSLLAALFVLAAAPVARAQYTFTLIADSTSPTFATFGIPSINSGGTAAFVATLDAGAGGGSGIFTGAGGATTTIALSSGPVFLNFTNMAAINAAGTVAFHANLDAGGTGIFTGAGGPTTPVALSMTTFQGFDNANYPAINAAGTVAFYAVLTSGSVRGIFTSGAGGITTIADENAPTFNGFSRYAAINAAGTVAFYVIFDGFPAGAGIFTGAGGAMTPIVQTPSPTLLSDPSINAGGTVAFRAFLAGSDGIFTVDDGTMTTIALSSGPIFSSFNLGGKAPSINTAGTVAFRADLDAGGSGIYVGNGGDAIRVIGSGDALFGSTVVSPLFGGSGLNDSGQVAFYFSLADGRKGIAVASPGDFVTQAPTLTAPLSNAVTGNPMNIGFTLPEAALNGTVKLTFTGPVTTVATLVNAQGTAGAHTFTLPTDNTAAAAEVASVSGPTALPDGTYTVTLQYQDALGNAAASATATNVTLTVTPYSQWKVANLGDVNAPDMGNGDGDDYVNLSEYGLVLNPAAFSTVPGGPHAYAEGERLRMIFTRDPARNDVTIEAEAADDSAGPWTTVASSVLGAPFTGPGYVGGDSAGPGLKTAEVRDVVNVDDPAHPRRFLRLRIRR